MKQKDKNELIADVEAACKSNMLKIVPFPQNQFCAAFSLSDQICLVLFFTNIYLTRKITLRLDNFAKEAWA